MSESLNIPEIYSPVFDYNGNLTTDINAAIISVANPTGIGTTVNYLGEVVPNPVGFAQTTNPTIAYSFSSSESKSPYVEPPNLLGLPVEEIPSSVGIASTYRLSPSVPVTLQRSLRIELNDNTSTITPSTLVVGITTVGIVTFTEEKKGQEITIDANVTGSMNGISMTVSGTDIILTVPGVGSATIPLTP